MPKYAPAIEALSKLLDAQNINNAQKASILVAIDWAEYLRAELANSQWGEGTWREKYNLLKGETSGRPCLKP